MTKTILLADDSLTIQKVVELTFADTGFEVVSTSSGDELLEMLPGVNADVIICDTIMPGSDGYSICQRIKSEPDTLHIPVILLTGTFEPFDRDRALAAGCSEIITKPFEARRLVETVERLVSGADTAPPTDDDIEEGAVAPPEFAGAVLPPTPRHVEVAEFGTLLAEPVAEEPGGDDAGVQDDGLDFTSTGFAEMEEAGVSRGDLLEQPPDQGLDYDPPTEDESFAEADTGEEIEPEDLPEEIDEELTEPFEPFVEEAGVGEPLTELGGGQVSDAFEDDDTIVDRAPDELEDFVEPAPEDDAGTSSAFEDPGGETPEAADPQEFEFGVAPEEPPLEDEVQEVMPPQPESAPLAGAPATRAELSDADVDRIARRVVELASDRLEQIAWEVIPDMAEIVVRERLRELEAEVERQANVPTN